MPLYYDKDFVWAAKYPFDKRSIDLLQSLSISMVDIIEDKPLIDEAFKEIEDAIVKGYLNYDPLANPYRKFVLFYLELLIVRAIGIPYVENRFIEAVSRNIYKDLSKEDRDVLLVLGGNLGFKYKLDPKVGNDFIGIFFTDFLKFSRRLSGKHWRIYYFPIRTGYVYIRWKMYIRLLLEAIKVKIYEMILNIEKIPDVIVEESEKFVEKISSHLPRKTISSFDIQERDINNYPPCIKYIIRNIGKGLSHPARFTLVTFLNSMGYSKEEIIQMFNVTPDFNEKVTRYQVEHILGYRGGKIRYNVPSCRKITSYNICFPDDICKSFGVLHPLKYVYIKKRGKKIKNE